MEEDTKKKLQADPDGLLTYEYIANHIDTVEPDLSWLVDNMQRVDLSGQFVISAARYLFAIDPVRFAPYIDRLIKAHNRKNGEGDKLRDTALINRKP